MIMKNKIITIIVLLFFISIYSHTLYKTQFDSIFISGYIEYCNAKEICKFNTYQIKTSFLDSSYSIMINDSIVNIRDFSYINYFINYFSPSNSLKYDSSKNIFTCENDTFIDTLFFNKNSIPSMLKYNFSNIMYKCFIDSFVVFEKNK